MSVPLKFVVGDSCSVVGRRGVIRAIGGGIAAVEVGGRVVDVHVKDLELAVQAVDGGKSMSKSSRERWAKQTELHAVEDLSARTSAFKQHIDRLIERARSKGEDEIVATVVRVGPAEAGLLLTYSTGNRHERPQDIEKYARDMSTPGAWVPRDDDPLQFTRNGRLGNGHHRLRAILKSGVEVRLVLSFGNDERAPSVVDEIVQRNMSARLAMKGRPVAPKTIAALRACIRLEKGGARHTSTSVNDIEEALDRHADAVAALDRCFSSKLPMSFWGAMIFAYPVAPIAVGAMAEEMLRPEGITGPAFTIREFILKERAAGNAGGATATRTSVRTLYAVRAYIERRPLTKFSPRDEDAIVEWFAHRRGRSA